MFGSELIPEGIKDYLRILINSLTYPGRKISTPHIGKNVSLGKQCSLGRGVVIGDNVVVGDYSYVNKGSIIASGTVGKFCSIAYNCGIGLAEHPTCYLSTSPFLYKSSDKHHWNEYNLPPLIGNDVWIGANAIIKQGVNIGHGSIIGAGSIVTKNVDPYMVVGGIPAKVLHTRFSPEVIEYLMNIQWWDKPISEINEIYNLIEL